MEDWISFPKLGITLNISKGFSIGSFNVRWYGVIICAGLVLCIFLGLRFTKKYGLNADKILDYILVAVPASIIGARTYFVAFQWDYYSRNPEKIIRIWEGGLAIYGAIIGALLAVFIMSKIRKDSFLHLVDFAMPYMLLGQAIGRWGNFTNQEAHGGYTTLPWGMTGSEIGNVAVHPTFLYESLWCFAAFAILAIYRYKFQKNNGEVTALYMILYGAERAIVEGLRTDSLMLSIGSTEIRVSQWLSIVLVIIGIALFIDFRRKGKPVSEIIGSPWPIGKAIAVTEKTESKLDEVVRLLEEESNETAVAEELAEEYAEDLAEASNEAEPAEATAEENDEPELTEATAEENER